jgi:hypothetical protein
MSDLSTGTVHTGSLGLLAVLASNKRLTSSFSDHLQSCCTHSEGGPFPRPGTPHSSQMQGHARSVSVYPLLTWHTDLEAQALLQPAHINPRTIGAWTPEASPSFE